MAPVLPLKNLLEWEATYKAICNRSHLCRLFQSHAKNELELWYISYIGNELKPIALRGES
jgi:hypothetical protein